jgi:hypothetical protein
MPIRCECAQCGGTFLAKPSKLAEGRGRFCGRRCYELSKRRSETRPCAVCNRSVSRLPSRFAYAAAVCSSSCRDELQRRSRQGPDNPRWRGGRSVENGYVQLWVGKDHPMSDAQGYVLEHRLVVSDHIGRPLTADEHVHHVNEQRDDNRVENLQLLTAAEHAQHHKGKAGRWARDHDACSSCQTTERRHRGHGLCYRCYDVWWERSRSGPRVGLVMRLEPPIGDTSYPE